MPKRIDVHLDIERLNPRADTLSTFTRFLTNEIEDAFSARQSQESLWRECLRQYEAIPTTLVKNSPIENAPNLEVPITMMSTDIFYSVSLQTIFNIDPLVTVSHAPGREDLKEQAKIFSDWNNWGVRQEFDARAAAEQTFLDNIQLGTGIFYIPWVENRIKTKTARITTAHPIVLPWPVEDFIVPGGSFQNPEQLQWIGLRRYYTEHELEERRKLFKWDISNASPVATPGWVRNRREQMGRSIQTNKFGRLYEVLDIYVRYDIDDDGFEEDLLVTYDRTSRSILKLRFNPYDHRPIEVTRYQKRAFLFYGMGIPEKLKSLQTEISDIHNQRNLNMLLANTRMWKVRNGLALEDNFKIWPGRKIPVNNPDDLVGEQLGDVYPSIGQGEQISMGLADRLIGLNEMTGPSPSKLLSSRTPATTAAIGSQQASSRFAAAFDSMQMSLAGAIKQCNWRYQERVLAGDTTVTNHMVRVLGAKRAQQIIKLYQDENFDEGFDIEFTATSNRTDKNVERQGLIQLMSLMQSYYERIMQLATIGSNPQVPGPVREVAMKIATAAGELIERTARTFDSIKDPKAFIIDIGNEMDKMQGLADTDVRQQLGIALRGMDELEGQNGQPQEAQSF